MPIPQRKANEIEVDFTKNIKNMNKIKESINTAVTAPAPEVKEIKAENGGKGELIQTTLLQMQHQYKILHWQTTSFSQHKSFDEIVSSLVENTDEFIEIYMGKYGRVIAANTFNISLANYKDTDFMALTDKYIGFLIGLNDMLDKAQDSDLLNIRDEILGSLNQLKYLLTLA
jgi:hypothetical protein